MARSVRRVATVLLLAGAWLAGSTPGALADQQTVFTVQMSGDQVIGFPGDPDGSGTATITVDHKTEQVCLDVDTTNVATPTEDYYIAEGAAGEPGGFVWVIFNVDINNPDPSTCFVRYNGFASFKELWKLIENNPEAFHLSVHNFEHADFGAIRGQLTLASK